MCPDILELLLKFRQNRIAFTADIEQAFLQISLADEDGNAVKFLWNDGELNGTKTKALRMTRVIFGATSSPFLLRATLNVHVDKYKLQYPNVFSMLTENMYVDDLIAGADEESEAFEESEHIKRILKEGGFNMRKWKTNETNLQRVWNEEDFSHDSTCSKVLGYIWNRILLQDLWEQKIAWDTEIPENLRKNWQSWCDELAHISSLEIPRHQFAGAGKRDIKDGLQLHCFTDASQKAYGAVLYFRYSKNGVIHTSFITSKSRVAPLKKLSLPRLELMGALIGSRACQNYIQKKLRDIDLIVYMWTDSSITLHWIRSDVKRWKPFVQNRVKEIQKNSDVLNWRYTPGEHNPADLLTRGENVKHLKQNSIWWEGPTWLKEEMEHWPKPNLCSTKNIEDSNKELRKTKEVFSSGGRARRNSRYLKSDKFWLLKARRKIKSVLYNCNVCKIFRTKTVMQDMAPLPPDRCREAFPFENSGIDYAGPLYVKGGKELSKTYVLLFTCAVTRAVHLELTADLSTENFCLHLDGS
ncbi:uncharacterized protein LOC118202575 [Stegodyphus dumicola]|uniref:uncharacterized protein LOC118202575 n=1 Tax=Stegodyphus dumicola TaxID=202533 RepID=UPI0015B066EE|nr:uncharacterized protein LOC118202575 [Stegodyphus dumicola]